MLHYFLNCVFLRCSASNKEFSRASNLLRCQWYNPFSTRDNNNTIRHFVRLEPPMFSRLVARILQLRTICFKPCAEHGFHFKPNTNVLVPKALQQQLGFFARSLQMLYVHCERNYLPFCNLDVYIFPCQLVTSLF